MPKEGVLDLGSTGTESAELGTDREEASKPYSLCALGARALKCFRGCSNIIPQIPLGFLQCVWKP